MNSLTLAREATAAVPLPEPNHSLLRMAIGADVLAVSIEHVREILQVGRLTPLPRTPAFVRGVMNLRGAVVPVIDLAARLSGAPADLGRRSCIVVVACESASTDEDSPPATLVVGLLVDAVFEVFDCGAAEVEPVPALGTRVNAHFLMGMTRARGEVIGVLALDRLLAHDDLAGAIAAYQPH